MIFPYVSQFLQHVPAFSCFFLIYSTIFHELSIYADVARCGDLVPVGEQRGLSADRGRREDESDPRAFSEAHEVRMITPIGI